MWTIFFTQLSFGLLALLICYSSGKIIASFFEIKGNFFFRLFVTYIIGITAIVLFYSVTKAHGRTVIILLLPIIGYLLYYYRNSFTKKPLFDKKETLQEFAWSLFPFIFVFLYQSFYYFDINSNSINSIWGDYYEYGNFSQSLRIKGLENSQISKLILCNDNSIGLSPYHYPELWLNAFFSSLFHNSTVNSYYFIMYPILVTIFVLGISSLFKNKVKNKLFTTSISILLLFVTCLIFPFYDWKYMFASFNILGCFGVKLAWIYIFILLGFITWELENDLSFYIFLSIPIFSSTFLPAIWGGLFFLNLFFLIYYLPKIVNQYLKKIVITVLFFISYKLFYYFSLDKTTSDLISNTINNNEYFKFLFTDFSLKNIKKLIIIFYYNDLQNILLSNSYLFYLSPYILILAPHFRHQKKMLLFIIISTLLGILTLIIFKGLLDSHQFSTNLISIYLTIIIIGIVFIIDNNKLIIIILIPLFLYGLSIQKTIFLGKMNVIPSKNIDFYKNVSIEIDKKIAPIMVFYDSTTFSNKIFLLRYWGIANDLTILHQYNSNSLLFFLGNPESYFTKKRNYSIDDSIYYNQLSPIKVWQNKGIDFTLTKYIRKYHIKYFYFLNGAKIPNFITTNSAKTIESPITHNIFIVLK